jgi:Ca2+-binding RTX toxin-like protein
MQRIGREHPKDQRRDHRQPARRHRSTRARRSSDALKQVISLITSTSDQRQESDKSKLIHGGQAFLDKLSGSDTVLVHEITLTTSNNSAPAQPIIISGSATNGGATETLVIDASQLPAGTVINLKNVEFAVIIGNAIITGGDGSNIVYAGTGDQTLILGEYDDELHGGDGTDTVANVEILRFTDGKGDMSAGSVVTRLYEGLLARSPDAAGFKFWVSAVEHGISLEQVAESMLDSDEATQLHSTVTNAAYVSQFYRNVLQRDADPEGHAFWTRAIDDGKLTRGGAALAIANSHESLARPQAFDVDFNTTDVATIVRLYDSLFARMPDADGLNFWIGASEAGVSMADIADSFIHSAESVRIYSSMSNAEFVNALYETALDRQPGGNEADGWIGSLDRGQLDRGDVLLGFANSPEKIGLVGMQSTSIETI